MSTNNKLPVRKSVSTLVIQQRASSALGKQMSIHRLGTYGLSAPFVCVKMCRVADK